MLYTTGSSECCLDTVAVQKYNKKNTFVSAKVLINLLESRESLLVYFLVLVDVMFVKFQRKNPNGFYIF